jgi:hypothetical protein
MYASPLTSTATRRIVPPGLRARIVHGDAGLRLFGCEVVQLGPVDVRVVELPLVVVEMAPTSDRWVVRHDLPAVVPDRP